MSLETVLAVVAGVLPVAAPFLAALYKLLVSNLPASKLAQAQVVVGAAVTAAEQVYRGIPESDQAKREWVISRIQAVLGKKVPAALIEVLLEEAVAALPHSAPAPSPASYHSAI